MKLGDVYCIFLEIINKYCAYQIIDEKNGLIGIISLDYLDSNILQEKDLKNIKILYRNVIGNKKREDIIYTSYRGMPKSYIYIGNTVRVCDQTCTSPIDNGWPSGEIHIYDYYWSKVPKDERYIYLSNPYKTPRIDDEMLEKVKDWSELDKCVSRYIQARKYYDGMIQYMERRHILTELSLINHNQVQIDIRRTNITELHIDGKGLKNLYLNDNCLNVHIIGKIEKDLTIHSCNNGNWLELWIDEQEYGIYNYGLNNCKSLCITEIKNIDINDIINTFKNLKTLRMWGRPGYIFNFNLLKKLNKLEFFTTVDLFGFNIEDIPKLNEFTNICSIWMHSLPKDVATHIKKTYKDKTLDLRITSPRNSEWLEKNMNNPFRDWDLREGIPKSKVKKASEIYNTTKANIANVIKEYGINNDNKYLVQSISNIVLDYAKAFNKLDNIKFIETIESEEIFLALKDILSNTNIEVLNDKLEQFYDDFENTFQNLK